MSKIVVLNSGGFDSIVLLNYTYTILGEKDLYSLHFKYGALNEKQQEKCVDKVCEKLGIKNKKIILPEINWTKSDFFKDNEYQSKGQYLEWRNLIFLSYAMSYAEAVGADKIFLALLNNNDYPDTTQDFIAGLNYFSQPNGIYIDAPFLLNNKSVIGHYAKYLGIKEDDFFSCDKPVNDRPCGVCPDCLAIKEIFQNI